MHIRRSITAMALGLSGLAAAFPIPATMAAATTTAATTNLETAACPNGHWPAVVQGQPTLFHAGARGGDYIWHDANGWHLRVTHAGTARVVFSGRIASSAPLAEMPVKLEGRDFVALSADHKVITYRFVNYGRIDGIDFKTACAQSLTFGASAAGSRLPIGRIWVGHGNHHPLTNPFVVKRVI
jgi:hypothetical protein